MSQLTPVPNPTTKFAWVPSEISGSLLAFQNISYLALGLWVWDLLIFCDYDFRLLRNSIKQARHSPRAAFIQGSTWYLLERVLTTVANILYVVYYSFDPMGNCAETAAAFTTFYALAAASATMLLSMRVFAIWDLRKIIVIPLCVLWVIVLGADLTLRWAVEGVPILNAQGRELGCVGSIPAPYTFAGFTATLVNDAACSALVLWRVTRPDLRLPTSKEEKKSSVINMGEGNTVTKVIKYQTIFYYTITTTSTLVALALQKAKRLDPVAQIVWSAFNLTVQNLVASHMYRGLRSYAAPTGNTGSQGSFGDRRTSVIEPVSASSKVTHFPTQENIEIGNTRKPADFTGNNGGVTMNTTTVQRVDAPSPVMSVNSKGSYGGSTFSPHSVKYHGWERSPDLPQMSLSNTSIDQRSHSLTSTTEDPPVYIIK